METELVVVCPVEDVPPGTHRIFEVPPESVGIYNTGGRIYAVRNVCPHRGAPLCAGSIGGTMLPSSEVVYEYGLADYVMTCPWHAREFDVRTGRSLLPNDRSRVDVYRVVVVNGQIAVDLSASPDP